MFSDETRLLALQEASGCFPSRVVAGHARWADRNGFAAALVLRALGQRTHEPALARMTELALDFIEACRALEPLGAFGFWPAASRPPWGRRLLADLDDTAVMTTELVRHGRLAPVDAQAAVRRVYADHRAVATTEPRPCWIQDGAFLTWVGAPLDRNPVDCTVNANVVALLARLGCQRWPGYAQAVSTIEAGLGWANGDTRRLRQLSPFYPSPHDLLDALGHATESGACELSSARARLAAALGVRVAGSGYCSSAYGAVVWHCDALDEARRLASLT